jgi:hypothetical protein
MDAGAIPGHPFARFNKHFVQNLWEGSLWVAGFYCGC